VEAAFFDLDKTVIAKPSIMAFARDFRREGLLTRRTMVKGLWVQLIYVRVGAGHKRLHRVRRSVLAATTGWDQAQVRRVVTEGLAAAIDPITYVEARDLIDEHRSAGRRVYLVSAAPSEIVEPLAYHLGAHEALASVARVDQDGRYTGDVERYAYGPEKASLISRVAAQNGIDLSASWAYTDSATDVPMLETVGHPVAVNPDRALRRIAQLRSWDTVRFTRTPAPATPASMATEPLSGSGRDRPPAWVWCSSAAAAAALMVAGGAVAWRSRTQAQLGAT
jgi:HAD superfamily hydrolase (TIGR01490 family)